MQIEAIQLLLQQAGDNLSRFRHEITALFNAMPDPIFVIDKSGNYIEALGGNAHTLYSDARQSKGYNINDLFEEPLASLFQSSVDKAIAEETLVLIEYQIKAGQMRIGQHQSGTDRWFEGRIYPITSPEGGIEAVLWLAINITEKKQLQLELEQMAHRDPLTGCYNRRYLYESLRQMFAIYQRHQAPLSLMMLDIDLFKSINDCHGHDIGDKALQSLVTTVAAQLRASDLFARFGGEEFILVLNNTGTEAAFQLAERIRQAVADARLPVPAGDLQFTVSIGVSEAREDDLSEETLLKRADTALYQAKEAGRNRVVASESISNSA